METDRDYRNPVGDDRNLVLKFFHERLGFTQQYISMAGVNSDARKIALGWAAEQGVEVRDNTDGEGPMFLRPFHPECDILYVSPRDWDDFIREPQMLPFELEIFTDQFYAMRTEVRRLAVSEASFRQPALMMQGVFADEDSLLWDIESSHPAVKALYVVVDPPPDARSLTSGDMSVPWRLEVEEAQVWELGWVSDHEGVRQGDSFIRDIQTNHGLEGGLRSCLADVSKVLHESYIKHIARARPGILSTFRFEISIAHIVNVG